MQTIIGLTIQEWTLVAWVAGALWSILLPYFRKWKESGFILQFNPGYLVNFFMSVGIGVTLSLTVYATWTPPDVLAPLILLGAFLAGAGIDNKVFQDILKWVNFYSKIWDMTRGKPVQITPDDIPDIPVPEPPTEEIPSPEDLVPPPVEDPSSGEV
jgi:hypothetical protein